MTDLLTAYAASQPDKIAVIDDRGGSDVRKCTYAELEARANQVAHVLNDEVSRKYIQSLKRYALS